MKRKFAANVAFLIFVNLLVKPFWIFGIDRTVQNVVGAEEYGIYFALFNFSVLFHIVLDFGINNYNNRSVAQDENFLRNSLPDILLLKLGLIILYLIVTLFSAWLLNFNSFQIHLLILLTFNQAILSLVLYFRSNLSGMHLFKIDSLLSVTDKVLMILICGFLLWSHLGTDFKIEWFVYAQTVSLMITVLIAAIIVLQKAGRLEIQWKLSRIFKIIKGTYPYALLGLLMSIYYRIDGVMIERMLPADGAYEAGVYAASYRLLDAANMIGFLFATILLPMFARMIQEREELKSLINLSFKTIFVWATFLVITCVFYREQIISLLYIQSTGYWAQIFGWLIPAYLGVCTVYIFGTLLTANGSLRQLNIIAVAGVILNVLLNFYLINSHKAFGATIATVVTQSLVALAHIIVAIRVFNLTIGWRKILPFVLFIMSLTGLNFALIHISETWFINFIISGIASILFAHFLKLLNLSKVLILLKSRVSS